MTIEQAEARIAEIDEEIESLKAAEALRWAVEEGLIEVEEGADGEYRLYKGDDLCYLEIPAPKETV